MLFDRFAAGARLSEYVSNYADCRAPLTSTIFSWAWFSSYQDEVKKGTVP